MRVALLAPLLALTACSRAAPHTQGSERAIPVELLTLAPTAIRDTTEYVATLKSRRSILIQPQVDGQLVRIFVKSGDTVDANQPLMQIDPSKQRATVTSVAATRASRQATLNFAKQAYERAQRLFQGGAVSQQELDQARSNYHSAQAEVNALGAQIRESEVQLHYYRITAPAHGVVGDIPVRVGDHVTPATKLTTLDENNLLEVYVSVPVEKAAQLSLGTPLELVDATGALLAEGKITFISPQVNEETQSVLVKSLIDNEKNTLRAAQFARARVVWSEHQGVIVPALAVLRLNGQSFVFVAEKRGNQLVAHQQPVALGELGATGYPVRAGLTAGQRIIVGGVQKMADGAPIAPRTAEPKG